MEIRKMSYEEACEEILKRGGFQKYRESSYAHNQVDPAPVPIVKSPYVRACDAVEKIIAARGITLTEYFKENPAEYRLLRQMGYAGQ